MQSLTESERKELSNKIPKLVGEKIILFRNSRNLTQTELAAMVGKDRQYLYKIEKGRVTPNISTLAIIARALEVSLSELLTDVRF